MKVKVYADVACPWSRLGAHRFGRAVGGGREVELVHLPYQLDPDAPEHPRPLMEAMAEMFGRDRADLMAAEMTRLGRMRAWSFGSTVRWRLTPSPRTGCYGSLCVTTAPKCRRLWRGSSTRRTSATARTWPTTRSSSASPGESAWTAAG